MTTRSERRFASLRLRVAIGGCALLAAAARAPAGAPGDASPGASAMPRFQDGERPLVGEFAPRDILWRAKGETTPALRAQLRELAGAVAERELWHGLIWKLELAPGADLAAALRRLNRSGLVRYAEPNFIVHPCGVPNDPLVSQQWQFGQASDADMDMFEAWDLAHGSANVILATIDSGFDYNHPDLSPKAWVNPGEIAGNGIDDDGDGWIDDVHGIDAVNHDGDPMDDLGHGTSVAGVAGAATDNGQGIAGVAWNARVMGCKFISSAGSGTFGDAITCLDFAVAHGANVSNHSYTSPSYSQAMYDAFDLAGDAGHLAIVPGGNSSQNLDAVPGYPVCFDLPEILATGATDDFDALAGYSDYGKNSLDVLVPGVNIQATTLGGGYGAVSANSFAAPTCTGLAALLAEVSGVTDGQEIKRWITESVDAFGSLGTKCSTGGRINAWHAVQRAMLHGLSTPLWSKDGTRASSNLGRAVCKLRDLDGDGIDDLAVGCPGDKNGTTINGTVFVVSGATGATIRAIAGPSQVQPAFGASLADLGDVNGDGKDDFVIGMPDANSSAVDGGGYRVVSGADGATIVEQKGTTTNGHDGRAVAAAGDLNGDGSPDFVIGGPGVGRVVARKATSGTAIWTVSRAASDEFGSSIANVGRIDGDAIDDFLVGSPGIATAEVLSGASGATLYVLNYGTSDRVGATVANLGDLDRDGFADFGIANDGRNRVVRVVSGAAGALLYRWNPPAGAIGQLCSFAPAEDVDRDRVPDFWVAWRGLDVVELRSGVDGSLLQTIEGGAGGGFGAALAGDADLDGDGAWDLVVGATDEDPAAGTDAGRIHAYKTWPFRLDVSSTNPNEGDFVDTIASGGETGELYLLAGVELNGLPIFEIVVLDVVDEFGRYEAGDFIPTGWSGNVFTLQAFTIKYARNRIVMSNQQIVTVQ